MIVAGVVSRLRSLWRGVMHRDGLEAEMAAEFRHHLQLRTEELVRRGLPPNEAARQARLEFGHVDGHKADARASRGLAPFDAIRFSALDVRLGLRMLVKYPGLSVVAVTGMSVAIAIGIGVFSVIASLTEPALPLPEGDRVVAVRNAVITEPGRNRASLRDFIVWRDQLQSVRDLSAFTAISRTLVVPGAEVDLVRVARMSASGFKIARGTPLLGRPLLEDDERSDARVVVIGFEEWQRRFASDPGIIGRRIGLGTDVYTIVGVMPDGFRFPVNDRYWIPLVFAPSERERADAVSLTVFGRLAAGESIEGAQAELSTLGSRMATANPETHGRLRPRVVFYTRAFFDIDTPEIVQTLQLFLLFISLLLVVVAVNVAILVYARTATRVGEIAVRTALGASRTRVVTQLFAEALVLSMTAAVVGLTIAGVTLEKLQALAGQSQFERRLGKLPFWLDVGLSRGVITYALVLALVGAAIVGVLPALKATGRRMHTSLKQLSGHGARMQLGRAWTMLIIAQVAVAVAVLPFAVAFTEGVIADATQDPGYPADEFLEASLNIDRAGGSQDTSDVDKHPIEARFRARAAELIRRLESDPAVAGVTMHVREDERIEVEGVASSGRSPIAIGTKRVDRVDAHFFALYGMSMLSGRTFGAADERSDATGVIVNQVFAENRFGSVGVLGRRLRFVHESATAGKVEAGPWLEIVGVVRDFETHANQPEDRIYLPADPARLPAPISLALRIRVSPATSFVPRLRALAAGVDPMLQLDGLVTAAERHGQTQRFLRYMGIGTAAVMLSVLLLSAAGIYAMMSFTVASRRREIGIRSALGADPRRLLGSIFARASAQLISGIVLGVIGTIALDRVTDRGPVHDGNAIALLLVAALMATVGLLAAIGPARRGLAVQPTDALREE